MTSLAGIAIAEPMVRACSKTYSTKSTGVGIISDRNAETLQLGVAGLFVCLGRMSKHGSTRGAQLNGF